MKTKYLYTTHIDFSHQSYSNIDLICSTNVIAHVLPIKSTTSYSVPMTLQFTLLIIKKKNYNIKKASKYSPNEQDLKNNITDFYLSDLTELSPADKYNFFIDKITKTVTKHTPKKRKVHKSQYRNPVRWWDADCYRIKRKCKATFKK